MTSRPIRILIVGSANSVHVVTRSKALADVGAVTTIVSSDSPANCVHDVDVLWPSARDEHNGDGWRARLQRFRELARLIRTTPADVLYVHYASGLAAWLAQMDPRPLAVCIMGSDTHPQGMSRRSSLSRWLTRRLLRQADLITAKSPYLAEAAVQMGASPERVIDVLWGVAPERFHDVDPAPLRRELAIEDDARVAFSPRMMRPQYNIRLLVEAIPAVLREIPNACFILSEQKADEAYRKTLRERLYELGLSEAVRFVGVIPPERMPEFYALADVTVNLYTRDGFPQSILESMASGTACVAGGTPALECLVDHGQHVWFVSFNAKSVADGVIRVISDDPIAERLVAAGRAFVRDRANLQRDAERVRQNLSSIASSPRRDRRRSWLVTSAIVLESLHAYARRRLNSPRKGPNADG